MPARSQIGGAAGSEKARLAGRDFESQAKLLGPIPSFASFSSVFLTKGNEDNEEEGIWTCDRLSSNLSILLRCVDKSATSVLLNVAEGNGRYSELDHHRFLEIAAASAVKAAAYLDFYALKRSSGGLGVDEGRELLSRITAMLGSF